MYAVTVFENEGVPNNTKESVSHFIERNTLYLYIGSKRLDASYMVEIRRFKML